MESCANCGCAIGKLETPHIYKDHIVCGACYQRLSSSQPTQQAIWPIPPTTAPVQKPPPFDIHAKMREENLKVFLILILVAGTCFVLYLMWQLGIFYDYHTAIILAVVAIVVIALGVRLGQRRS